MSERIKDALRDALPYVTALQLEKPVISDAMFERGTRALEELRTFAGVPWYALAAVSSGEPDE